MKGSKPKSMEQEQTKSKTQKWLFNLLPILVITLLNLIFFSEQIFGAKYFWSGYWSDITEFSAAYVKLNAEALKAGSLPFWNPYSYSGFPHLADPVNAFFYPVNYIGYLLINQGMDLFDWMKWSVILHFWLMQLGMYYFLRYNKLGLIPAIFGSIAFAFSGATVGTSMIPNFLYNYAYLPWFVLALQYVLSRKSFPRALILGLVAAFMFLGGNPNMIFFVALYMIIYLIFWVFEHKADLGKQKKLLYLIPLSLFIFLALTSAQLKEVMDFIPFSQRAEITYDFASDGSLSWRQLSTIVNPKVFGVFGENETKNFYWLSPGKVYHYWETCFYFGIATFILAGIGFVQYRKNRLVLVSLATIIFMLLFSLGDNGPIFKFFFNYIPGFNVFRIPSRALFLVSFSFSIVAAFGIQALLEKNKGGIKMYLPLIATALLWLIAYSYLKNMTDIPSESRPVVRALMSQSVGLFFVSILVTGLMAGMPKLSKYLGVALCLIVFVDLSLAGKSYKNSDADPHQAYQLDRNSLSALYPALPQDFFRIGPKSLRYRLLRRNGGVYMDLFNSDGVYGIQWQTNAPAGVPISDLLAQKYYIAHQEQNGQVVGYGLEEIPTALPFARMLYNFQTFDAQPQSLENFDFRNSAAVMAGDFPQLSPSAPDSTASVVMTEYELNRRLFKIDHQKNGLLAIGERFYPGWKAFLDGGEVPVKKINYLQAGVFVPQGSHSLELKYEKPFLNGLIYLHFICLAGVLIYLPVWYYYLRTKQQ